MAHDIGVVGGGCMGLSIARELAKAGHDVCLVEKEYRLGTHQSGRNSGVLHPGFNYDPNSLKARFATEGTSRMKAFAAAHGIPCREFGVLVLATNAEDRRRLDRLVDNAEANGVDVDLLEDIDEIRAHEPAVEAVAALHCPSAASIDSHAFVAALANEAKREDVSMYLGHEVRGIELAANRVRLRTTKGYLEVDHLINAAGLHADRIAHHLGVGGDYRVVPFRGEYYELVPDRRSLVNGLVYPTPDPQLPFLGVHFTRRTDDKVIVGPNAVLAFGRESYSIRQFDLRDLVETVSYPGTWRLLRDATVRREAVSELASSLRKGRFVRDARTMIPEIESADLTKSYAGNRAQIVSRGGELVTNPLVLEGPRSTHVLNATSPGLTSCLPFGEHVAAAVSDRVQQ